MRRYYKKQYQPPARRKPSSKPYQLIQQPEWDDTIHDLSHLKLSPEEQLRRKLSCISKNQLGVATLGGSNPLPGRTRSLSISSRTASQSAATSMADCCASTLHLVARSTERTQQIPANAGSNISARYTPSVSSADDQCPSDSGDESSNENEHQAQRHAAGRHQQVQHRHRQPGFESEDDICQWQDAAASPLQEQRAILGDIGNSSRSNGPRGYENTKHQQQDDLEPAARAVRHAAEVTTASQAREGHIVVPTETLQALFDKIDNLETQLRQQQEPSSAPQQQSAQVHQQMASSQQQLSETQQQLAALQAEHQKYVSHTSSLLTRLQAQLQQIMSQSPGTSGQGTNIIFGQQQSCAGSAAASRSSVAPAGPAAAAPARYQSHNGSILDTLGPAPVSSSIQSSMNKVRSPAKQHLRAALAVFSTASPNKSTVAGLQDEVGSSTATSRSEAAMRLQGGYAGAAAAATADALALPSYAEMRQRASFGRGSYTGLSLAIAASDVRQQGTGGQEAAATAVAGHAAAGSTEEPVLAASSSSATAERHATTTQTNHSSNLHDTLFGRAVPQPLEAWNIPNAAAAATLGSTASLQQQQLEQTRWSNAAQVAPVIARFATMLNPAIAADAGIPGLRCTDWGLGEGLPRAAVSRVFTSAGRFEGIEAPKPRVLLDQLKGNVSLSDHLRAAQSAAKASVALQ